MADLYEITVEYQNLFDEFDAIENYEFDTNVDGYAIDGDGNIIPDPHAFKKSLLQAWFDTLEGIEGEFEEKAENIACFIKNLKAEADAIESEEKALRARKEQKRRKLESLKKYLLNRMQQIKRTKIDTPKAKLTIRSNAESVVVDDEKAFIIWAELFGHDDLLKYSEPEIRKTDTKKYIQGGGDVPNAHLERSQSLIIK